MRRQKNRSSFGTLACFMLCFFAVESQAQSLQRQSIGDLSTHQSFSNLHIQQTVGQSFPLYSVSFTARYVNPGFIQGNHKISAAAAVHTQLSLYPNPAHQTFKIQSDRLMGPLTLTVIDLQGREIFRQDHQQMESVDLDCSAWVQGVYIVSIMEHGIGLFTSKIIISE